jgi:hypothetical protein
LAWLDAIHEFIPSFQCQHPTLKICPFSNNYNQIFAGELDLAMNQTLLLLVLAGAATVYVYQLYIRTTKTGYKLPPLVPGIPIFGNALQVPSTQQGPWAKELAEKYGEMYALHGIDDKIGS